MPCAAKLNRRKSSTLPPTYAITGRLLVVLVIERRRVAARLRTLRVILVGLVVVNVEKAARRVTVQVDV